MQQILLKMCFFKEINFTFMDKIGFLMKKGYFAAFLLFLSRFLSEKKISF